MATNIGTLMIGVRGDVAALHADVQSMNVIVRRGFDQMGADMRRAEQAGRQFSEQMRNASMSLRGLVAEAAGLAGIGSAMATVFAVPKAGVKYAAEMETMRLGMAGTLASMGQIDGKAIDIGKAVEISAVITGKLQQKAMETSANMHELVGAYQAIIGPGLQAGASLEKMVDFVTAGTVAVKSMGLKSGQVVQELRDLVQGGIQPASSTLATAIGVGDKDIKEIKAKGGDLIGFLMDRMKGFAEASTLYAQTFTGKVSGMQEAFNILAAQGSEPIFDALKAGIDGVMNTMGTTKEIIVKNGDEVKKSMTWTVDPAVVAQIRDVSQNVVDLSKSAISVGQALWEWREPIGYIAAAMVTIKGMRFAGAVGDGVGKKFQELRSYFAAEKDAAKAVVGAASGEVERAKAIQLRTAAQELASKASLKDALAATEVAAANKAAAQSEVPRQSALVRSLDIQRTIASANFDVAKGTAAEAMAQKELAAAQRRYSSANEELITGKTKLRELTQAETAAQTRLAAVRDAALGATNANTAATSRLSLATNGLVAAKEREAAAQSIAAMAGRAASGVLAALGGPIGVAILAIFGMVMAWDHLADSTVHAADAAENSANRIRAALKSSNFAAAESERARLDALYAQQTAESNKVNGLLENMRKRGEDKTMPGLYAQYLGSRDQWANILSGTRAGLAKVTTEINEAKQAQASAALKNVEKAFDPRDYKAGGARKYQQFDLSSVKPRFDKNYKDYMEGEGLTTTKEEDRAKKLEKENQRFALALRDVEEGSAKHAELLQRHKDRIAKINKEDKEGSGKGARSLPVDIRALADEEARLQQVRAQIEQVRKSGLAKPDMTDGEKAAEKYRQEAAAARELGKASLAAAKDKLAARAVVRGEAERELKELERANQLRLEFTQADEKRAADLKIANEEAENEYKWLALSNEERAAAQAAWEVEKKARQEILDLQKQQREATTAELKDQLASRIEVVRSQAEEDKITAAARARRQSSLQEWGQIGSDIERALTDSIMRGFEGGKSGIESFKDAIKNSFKTFVVKLLVQPMMNEINSLGAQLLAGQSGVGGAAGGLSLDSLMGLGKMAGKAGDGLSWLGDALGMDSLKSLGGSLNNLMGGANSAGAALNNVGSLFGSTGFASSALDSAGSFLSSSAAYGMGNSLSSFSSGLANASGNLSSWSTSLTGLRDATSGVASGFSSWSPSLQGMGSGASSGAGSAASGASSLSTYAGYASAAYNLFNSIKTGKGWGSTIGSAAYLIPGIGPIAGTIGTLLGGLADSAFGHKGGPKTGGNANAVFDSSGNVVAREMFGGYTPDQLDKSMRDQISALQTSYAGLTKALGGTVRGLTINLGGDQDPQGKAGNRVSAQIAFGSVGVGAASVGDAERALWDKALYSSVSKGVGGDFDAALKLEVSRMLVAAVRGSDLPDEVAKIFSSVDLSAASQDQLDVLIAQAQALASLNNAFKALAPILPQLSGLSLDAKRALTDLAGGLDQFVSNAANWRANFYSKAEQDNATRKALADDLAKVGVALPATREEYRRLVEQMDITSDKGREAWTVMMKLSSGFASVTLSAEELAKQLQSDFSTAAGLAAKSLAAAQAADKGRLAVDQWLAEANGNAQAWNDKRRAALWGMYATAAPEQQLELLQELQGLMKERYQTEIDAVSGLVSDANRLKDAAKSLRDYVDGLRVGDLSPLTMGQRLAESAQQFADTLSKAQGGDKEALSALQGKASTYLGLGKDYYASSAPYSGAGGIFEQVTGSLSALGVSLDGMASGQLTAAQTAAAQAQYSAAALAEMTRLRDGFGALNSTLMQQTQRQASDAAAILLKMKDDEALAALKALPAELAAIIKGELSSLERSPYTGGSAKGVAFSDLVSGAYRSILQREPDQPGFQYWLGRLSSGELSPDAFSRQFVTEAVNYGERGGQWQPSIDRATAWAGKFFPDIVPQFAVGTNELPADMLALVHAGERIIPAADNAELFAKLDEPSQMAGGMAALASKVDQLVGLVGELILTLQQHGTLTSSASHEAAQEVVLAVESASKEAQWLARSAPMMT